MSANQQPWPGAVDTRRASLTNAGQMARWATASSGVASFGFIGTGEQRQIYVPLATSALAGALSAAQFAKLATLQVPQLRLSYTAGSSDLMSATAIAATTWTDFVPNQNLTLGATTSWLLVVIRLGLVVTTGAGNPEVAVRALLDSAGTPLAVPFSAGMIGGTWDALAGGAFLLSAGTFAAAGTHTIKLQIYANGAISAYLRASSQPNNEFAAITIAELNL